MKEKMIELITLLNKATEAYDAGEPIMKDTEWDKLYFQLVEMEKESGFCFPDSPTQTIHYNVINKLEKVVHSHPMLSLDKTKNIDEILAFVGNKPYIAMLKMDGLTCSLTYREGKLIAAETRGNGTIGENILHNAQVVANIPTTIPTKEEIVVDGEIICSIDNFKKWDGKYANPRNFASGSIRLLDNKECQERGLSFIGWDWINSGAKLLSESLEILKSFGFTTVPYLMNSFEVETLTKIAEEMGYPIDGLVVKYDNREYYQSLGQTSHHFKGGLAFKFADDSVTSYLKDIVYDVSRNGILTPVAIYEEAELEGTINTRASLHNLTVMEKILGLPYVGQEVEIVKQNMINPQILSSVKKEKHENSILLPERCPICGNMLEIVCDNESEVLRCTNPKCSCRIINQLDYYCSKKGLEIRGLSKSTLEKLMLWGWIDSIKDIYTLDKYRTEWSRMPGFGTKSVDNVLFAIQGSRKCELVNFISALGIPLVGPNVAKEIVKIFPSWELFRKAINDGFEFYSLKGFGPEKHRSLMNFNYEEADYIAENYLNFIEPEEVSNIASDALAGKIFVITGKLTHFKNRAELEAKIVAQGGRVSTSVSRKTHFLINNDKESSSAKNVAAQTAGIPIISEEDFIESFGII